MDCDLEAQIIHLDEYRTPKKTNQTKYRGILSRELEIELKHQMIKPLLLQETIITTCDTLVDILRNKGLLTKIWLVGIRN